MYEVECLNVNTNKTFSKWFYDEHELKVFTNKCKHGDKLKILGVLRWW